MRALLATLVLLLSFQLAEAQSTIKPDEDVVLFTTAAHLAGDSWVVPVHGWIFELEPDSIWRRGLVDSLRQLLQVSPEQEKRFRRRMAWFLTDNERGKRLEVAIAGTSQVLRRSSASGHFSGTLSLPRQSKLVQTVEATHHPQDKRRFRGRVLLVPKRGLSVISDVDDTMKITSVTDTRRMIRRVFVEDYKPVPGMVSLFARLRARGAVFHYVSASPWQLSTELAQFMRRVGFPVGSEHYRDFRLADHKRWDQIASPVGHKRRELGMLIGRFPNRQFILLGDSGQHDPEVYAEIAARFPEQVQRILIRQVPGHGMSAGRIAALQKRYKVTIETFESPDEI